MDKDDFTTNSVIDDIQIGDTTVDIVGYVTKVSNNACSSNATKFHKFVVNNARGREIQVIAWNSNTYLLQKVKEMGKIVFIGSAKASAIKNKIYNSGNVNFELLIKDNSVVEVYETYQPVNETVPDEVSIEEAFDKINQKIRIEGIIKTPLRKYKNRDFEYVVGSITDCNFKLELKVDADNENFSFKKGDSVVITGVMEQFPPGPPTLRVENKCHIQIISGRDRVVFTDILNGFRNKTLQ